MLQKLGAQKMKRSLQRGGRDQIYKRNTDNVSLQRSS